MATKTNFISAEYLKAVTPLGNNIDNDKLTYNIWSVQETYLQPVIGTRLLEQLKAYEIAGTYPTPYNDLMEDYVKDFIAWKTASESVFFLAYIVDNGGVFRHEPENGASVSRSELGDLRQLLADKAAHFQRRLVDHLQAYGSQYPEYYEWQTGDMNKDQKSGLNNLYF